MLVTTQTRCKDSVTSLKKIVIKEGANRLADVSGGRDRFATEFRRLLLNFSCETGTSLGPVAWYDRDDDDDVAAVVETKCDDLWLDP